MVPTWDDSSTIDTSPYDCAEKEPLPKAAALHFLRTVVFLGKTIKNKGKKSADLQNIFANFC